MNDEILVALAGTVGVGAGLATKNGWIVAFTAAILVIYLVVSAETKKSPSPSPPASMYSMNSFPMNSLPMNSFQHQKQPKSVMLPPPESMPTTRTDPVLGVPAATTQYDLLPHSAIAMAHQPSPLENMGPQKPREVCPPCPLDAPCYQPTGKGELLNPYMSKGDPRIWTPNVNDLVQDRMAQYGEQDSEYWRDHRKFLDARVKFARFQTADGSFGGKRDKYTRDPPDVAQARKAAESVQPFLARRQPLPSF